MTATDLTRLACESRWSLGPLRLRRASDLQCVFAPDIFEVCTDTRVVGTGTTPAAAVIDATERLKQKRPPTPKR